MSIANLGIAYDTGEEVIIVPPTDLWSDEPPLESDLHRQQMQLLIDCLSWWWRDSLRDSSASRNDFYASGNLTVYYNQEQLKSPDFRGPDFFVVLGVERKPRRSWVVWGEGGKIPNLIVEILPESTAEVDRGLKKQIYQDILRTPDYFWFDPESLEFAGFHLVDGNYQSIQPNPQGWLWSQQLQLYLGIDAQKLRFFTAEGQLLPTLAEVIEQEQQQKELAQQQAERLAAKLRELGIDPNI